MGLALCDRYVSGCAHGKLDARAARAAAAADVALVFVSATAGEGRDRSSLNLSSVAHCHGVAQEELIEAVAAKQPKTAVVMAVPGPVVTTGWRDRVAAILCAFLPGEQYGHAIADLVFGDVPPQARLPVSMPRTGDDQKMSEHQWPGIPSADFPGSKEVVYSEGQIVGYRYYDKHRLAPAFPFGFGLTYGSFSYAKLAVAGRTVSFTVSRTSGIGCDTPQLYLSYPSAASDPAVPAKVLRYFQKTCAASTDVSYALTDRDLSSWDVDTKAWVLNRGTFGLTVASASQGGEALTASLVV